MPSSLTWLDHDAAAQERSLRILSLFSERDTRDELGIGAVRDALADLLFPGTSTIQTRLRYMLFVPWMYRFLEEQSVAPHEMAARGRRHEAALIEQLRTTSDGMGGIIGVDAGANVKRLPSSVYWNGLAMWGIRRFTGSQSDYHRLVGAIVARRKSRTLSEDGPAPEDAATWTWSTSLPAPPARFPEGASFALTGAEAAFIRDRIAESQPASLFAHLVWHAVPAEVPYIWEHPDFATFRPEHRMLVDEGRRLSAAMHGAAILYNLLLAERRVADRQSDQEGGLVAEYRTRYAEWASTLDVREMRRWDVGGLWRCLATHPSAQVSRSTKRFVEYWVDVAANSAKTALDDHAVRSIIEQREVALKGAQARLRNQAALDRWGGRSGMGRLDYRWPITRTFLRDLMTGLMRDDVDAPSQEAGIDAGS